MFLSQDDRAALFFSSVCNDKKMLKIFGRGTNEAQLTCFALQVSNIVLPLFEQRMV